MEGNAGVTPENDVIEESSTSTKHPTEDDSRFEPQEDEETADSEQESEEESEDEDESGEEPTEKPKKGLQKRFSELTSRAKAAERERDYIAEQNKQLIDRLSSLNKQQTPQEQAKMEQGAPERPGLPPDRYDYASDSEFEAAVAQYQKKTEDYTRWIFREEQKAAMTEQQKAYERHQQQEASQKIIKSIETINKSGSEKYEDFAEVAYVPQSVVGAVAGLETAVDIAYHWGKHPEDRERINHLAMTNPVAAAIEIGALNERFKNKAKEATQAPPPPKTVGSNNTGNINPDKLSMDEWVKQRRAGKIK